MRTILRFVAILYIVYIAIAVLLVMPALNFLPPWYMQKTFDRQLHTDIVLLNPFTLSLEVRNAELPEHDGERFAAVGKAMVDLSLESIWQEGWVLDAVKVEGLYAHIRRLGDSEFNFSDMIISSPDDTAPDTTDGGIPGLTIHDFDFHSEMIVTTDETRETPYSTHWDGLVISVQDLSTVIEEGRPYRIDAFGERGGSLHWEGTVSVPGARSEGSLLLSNMSLRTIWRFAEPWIQFELKDSRLTIEGNYQLDWKDVFAYKITDGAISLDAVEIAPKTTTALSDTGVSLNDLTIAGISVDSQTQHASVASITVDGLDVAGWSEGSQVSLATLFAVELPEDPAAPEDTDADDTQNDDGWTADIKTTRLQDSSLHWRSEFTDPPLLEVTPIEASIDNVKWPLSGDSQLSLNLTANQQAKITIDGALALANGDGNIDYRLEQLPLPWFSPNLPAALKAKITDGFMQVQGDVTLVGYAPSTINMEGAIKDFSGKIEGAETALTSWDTVRLQGLAVDLQKYTVALQKLSINKYAGRVHILADGSINAQNVWQEEVGEKAEELAQDLELDVPWAVSVPIIRVTDSEIDFMDQSLPIVFRTVIGDLNGEVRGISTDAGAEAKVDIQGSVDGYAPVVLKGTTQPFSTPAALDLILTFDGVDLALLTPYSGTYAGYAIDRGLLDLHLKYALNNNHLEGHNDIKIGQLKLGEKVDSDKAVDVPLKLALALLTDANGVIDMQVPVTGNVDDPQFAVGSIIFNAFLNLITKAVTAPFNLLANLVASEEDLQRITFASGSAQLDEASKAKLDQLTAALKQRPKLTLVVTGRLNIPADRERLQKNILKQALVAAGLPQDELDSKGPQWEKAIETRYQALPGSSEQGQDLSSLDMYLAVVHSVELGDAQLIELAEQRAVAVKAYLVNDALLEPNRTVVEQTALDDEANTFSGVELGMGN